MYRQRAYSAVSSDTLLASLALIRLSARQFHRQYTLPGSAPCFRAVALIFGISYVWRSRQAAITSSSISKQVTGILQQN
jgi:uncharacterized membrane protein YozB (DUF420 family)